MLVGLTTIREAQPKLLLQDRPPQRVRFLLVAPNHLHQGHPGITGVELALEDEGCEVGEEVGGGRRERKGGACVRVRRTESGRFVG